MRIIKFRGIIDEECNDNKIDKVFVYGSLIHDIEGDIFCIQDEISTNWYIDEKTIGQYTGLKDRYGKMIYEGDIIDICRHDDEKTLIRAIVKDIRFLPSALFGSNLTWYEIIGNIHEKNFDTK